MNRKIILKTQKVFFRKFTRKKFSVFNSLHRVVHVSTVIGAYTLVLTPLSGKSQTDTIIPPAVYQIEEIEVVGQMSPSAFEEIPRIVTVISSSESECAPAQSITDLLQYSGAIDLRQRGKAGIQSDLSIRGGSFDHNLVLLNGLNISDPQTGHLSLNLPIETDAIEHVEILNGPAARVHGANAFSGAVNFVTKPSSINRLKLTVSAGDYGYLNNAVLLNVNMNKVSSLIHYNNGFSDGYTKNTDYARHGLFYQGLVQLDKDLLDIQFGYNTRNFGSNSFYTPRYPDQFESNQLSFMGLGYKTGENIKVNPKIYWRRHRDRWEMFREDADWYRVENGMSISNDTSLTTFDTTFVYTNHHISDVFGAQLTLSKAGAMGVSSMGWHVRTENIISNNIGYDRGVVTPVRGYDSTYYHLSDSRSNVDMHLEQTLNLGRLFLSGGLLINWNTYLPDEINFFPGVDMNLKLIKNLSLIGSYNYTLGLPTFTDLTYEDPNNSGNNMLKPYSQHSIEGAFRWKSEHVNMNLGVFYNNGKDVIDWVWLNDIEKFRPENISAYSAMGVEFNSKISIEQTSVAGRLLSSLHISYTYIDMDKEIDGDILKYFNVRNKAALMLQSKPIKGITLAYNIRFVDREGGYITWDFTEGEYRTNDFKPYWLSDLRLTYSWKQISVFAEATNLFDVTYIDIGSIYQPGLWLAGGLKFSLTDF